MRQFCVTYQYEEAAGPLGLTDRQYKARMTFWGIGGAPHYNERPYSIDVFRRPDGQIFIRYQGQGDVRNSDNPVINDLKTLITRQFGRDRIAYTFTPAHWRLTGVGD